MSISLLVVFSKANQLLLLQLLVFGEEVVHTYWRFHKIGYCGRALYEGQAGFREKRSCASHIFSLYDILHGIMRKGKHTCTFFLALQKAFDSFWVGGLWFQLWVLGVRGRMWRV